MPRYKAKLGKRPPELRSPRGREQTLRCSFDPLTLERECRTPFNVGQEQLAEKWLKRRWEEALRRDHKEAKAASEGRPSSPTLEDCLRKALMRGICLQTERPISRKTMDAYEDAVDLFQRWLAVHRPGLAPFRIADIDRDLITEYVGFRTSHPTDRADGFNKRAAPTERSLHRQVQGIKWAIVRGAPISQLEDKHYELMPRHVSGKSQPRAVYLNSEQMVRYFNAILANKHTGLLAMAICEALLGMRRNDAKGLRKSSFKVDGDFRYVVIVEASKKRPRAVGILPEVYHLIDTYVLPALPIKLPWAREEDSIYHPLRKAAATAQVPYASPNDLRASFAVLLLNAGIEKATVAEMMGTSIQMLKNHYDRATQVDESLKRQRISLDAARRQGNFVGLLLDKTASGEGVLGEKAS